MSENITPEIREAVVIDGSSQADPSEKKRKRPIPKTVKGMPNERWNAISRAAQAHKETIAEYLWGAHETRTNENRWQPQQPPPQPQPPPAKRGRPPKEVAIPRDDRLPPLSLVELFDIICKVASTDATPGNKALLSEARSVLYSRLRAVREGPAQLIAPPVIPGN